MSSLTKGCIVKVISYPGNKFIGAKGEVVAINKLNGDGPAEIFIVLEGCDGSHEEDFLAINEDEVEIVYTADQMERMRQEIRKRERWSRGEFTEGEKAHFALIGSKSCG